MPAQPAEEDVSMRLRCKHCGSRDIWHYIPGGGATGRHYRCKVCFGVTPEAETFEREAAVPSPARQSSGVNPLIADALRRTAEASPEKQEAINPLIADARRRAQATEN
jgi:hypothetical protein